MLDKKLIEKYNILRMQYLNAVENYKKNPTKENLLKKDVATSKFEIICAKVLEEIITNIKEA